MTLILKLDLDMVKMYLYAKNEVSMWSSSKVVAWTQTDMTENITYPYAGGNEKNGTEREQTSLALLNPPMLFMGFFPPDKRIWVNIFLPKWH